jgi:hypothetical protein
MVRFLKLALVGGGVLFATTCFSHVPASASPQIAGLSKMLNGAAGKSVVDLAQFSIQIGPGGDDDDDGGGASSIIEGIGAAAQAAREAYEDRMDRCEDRHDRVDRSKGVWYDRRGRAHPCR